MHGGNHTKTIHESKKTASNNIVCPKSWLSMFPPKHKNEQENQNKYTDFAKRYAVATLEFIKIVF